MAKSENCYLCDESADIRASKSDGGNRVVVKCTGSCPHYEITKWAIDNVENDPDRKARTITVIKALHANDPDDLPVVRRSSDTNVVQITTRGRESQEG